MKDIMDPIVLIDANILQMQVIIAVTGLLTIVSVSSFTLFLSSRSGRSSLSTGIAILMVLLPMLVYAGVGNNWISAILPASGVGVNSDMFSQLVDFRFLHLGSHSFWTPKVSLMFTAIWIPFSLSLAVSSYSKHQVMQ